MIKLIEGSGSQHADCRRGRQSAFNGEIAPGNRDPDPADAVVVIDIGSHPGHIGKVSSLLRHGKKPAGIHFAFPVFVVRDLFRSTDNKTVCLFCRRIDSLLNSGNNGCALHDAGVYRSVHAGPVRMLAEQAKPSRHEQIDLLL